MKLATLQWFVLAGSVFVASLRTVLGVDADLPDASLVMQRVAERAHKTEREGAEKTYAFDKRSTFEELDASGKATKTKEREYQVIPMEGTSFSRLTKIQNRSLTAEEIEVENRKEREFRQKIAHQPADPKETEDWLDVRLIERFNFKVEKRESLRGRSILLLSFHPKATPAPEKGVEDRVLNRLAGTLWVDEQEFEIAKLAVGLTEDLSLGWFGMIGSLKQFDLVIERERLTDGVWVTQNQTVFLSGRKLLSQMRYRTREESSNFRKP